MKKSLLAFGLLGSAFANGGSNENLLDDNEDTGIYQYSGVVSTTTIKHTDQSGHFDVEIKPYVDGTADAGTADSSRSVTISTKLTWSHDTQTNKHFPGEKIKVSTYTGTCAVISALQATVAAGVEPAAGDAADALAAANTIGGAVQTGTFTTANKGADGIQLNLMKFEDSAGTTGNTQDPTYYPDWATQYNSCIHIENGDNGNVKHFGKIRLGSELFILQNGVETEIGEEGTVENKIVLAQEYDLADSDLSAYETLAGGVTADDWHAGATASDPSTLSAAYLNTFEVKDVLVQEGFVPSDLTLESHALSALLKANIGLSNYANWKNTGSDESDKTSSITPKLVAVGADQKLKLKYDGSLAFKLPYQHVKRSYVAVSGCVGGGSDNPVCTGGATISFGISSNTYDVNVVDDSVGKGWDHSGHYTCENIGASGFATKGGDNNPFNTGVAANATSVKLSDLFEKSGESSLRQADCDLDDQLTFHLPTSDDADLDSSSCATDRGLVRELTPAEASSWVSTALGDCVVNEPSEPNGDQDSEAVYQLRTTTIGAGDSEDVSGALKTVMYSVTRNEWSMIAGEHTNPSIMQAVYQAGKTKYSESQVTPDCSASQVQWVTGGSMKITDKESQGYIDPDTCAFSSGIPLTAVNIDVYGQRDKTNTDYGEPLCSDLDFSISQTVTMKAKFKGGGTVADVPVSVTASQTVNADIIDTISGNEPDSFGTETGVALDDRSVSITFNGIAKSQDLATAEAAQTAPNCVGGKDVVFSKDIILPCRNSGEATTVSKTYTIRTRHAEASLPVVLSTIPDGVAGPIEIFETESLDENGVDQAYFKSSGSSKTLPGAIKFSSVAIATDDDLSKLAIGAITAVTTNGDGSNGESTVYVVNNCAHDLTDIKCDLVISETGSNFRADIATGGDDVTDVFEVALQYNYADKTECNNNNAGSLHDVAAQQFSVKYKAQDNKYGGKLRIKDITNQNIAGVETAEEPQTDNHVKDVVMQYPVPLVHLGTLGGDHLRPKLRLDLYAMDGTAEELKIGFDNNQLEMLAASGSVVAQTIASCSVPQYTTQGTCETNSGVWTASVACPATSASSQMCVISGSATSLFAELKPRADYENPGTCADTQYATQIACEDATEVWTADHGVTEAFETFDLFVQNSADTSRRNVKIQPVIAADASKPVVSGEDDFVQVGSYFAKFVDGFAMYANDGGDSGKDFREVSFDIRNVLVGGGSLNPNGIPIYFDAGANNPVGSPFGNDCKSEGVELGTPSRIITKDQDSTAPAFITTSSCIGRGAVAFSFENTCYEITFKCKRHGTVDSTSIVSVDLDYRSDFSLTSGLSVSATGGEMRLGGTCDASGTSTNGDSTSKSAACTKDIDSDSDKQIFGGGVQEVTAIFIACHNSQKSIDGDNTGDTLRWEMNAVRAYVGSDKHQDFCQSNLLTYQIQYKGSAKSEITVSTSGAMEFSFEVIDFSYTADTASGACPADQRKLVLTISSSAADAGTQYDLQTSDHATQALTNGEDPNSVIHSGLTSPQQNGIITISSGCQDFCGDGSDVKRGLGYSFTAMAVHGNGQQFYADVTGQSTIHGNPCDTDSDTAGDLDATFGVYKPDTSATACAADATYGPTVGSVTIADALCFKLEALSTDFDFAPQTPIAKVHDGTDYQPTSDYSISSVADLSTATVKYYKISSLQLMGNKDIQIEIPWQYDLSSPTGTGRRMLRSTVYLLGSGDGSGESDLTFSILPAGVQVQEQIEAAGASQEAPPASDVMAPAPSGVEDHSHDNTALTVGLGVVGVGVLAVIVVMSVQAAQSGRADKRPSGSEGYQRVGRFQSNLAF